MSFLDKLNVDERVTKLAGIFSNFAYRNGLNRSTHKIHNVNKQTNKMLKRGKQLLALKFSNLNLGFRYPTTRKLLKYLVVPENIIFVPYMYISIFCAKKKETTKGWYQSRKSK